MLRVADLAPELVRALGAYRLDRLTDKHERWLWAYLLPRADFLDLQGYHVLLPVPTRQHAQISLEHLLVAPTGELLTLMLRDTTGWERLQAQPATRVDAQWQEEYVHFLAVCVRVPGQAFFIATLYHACLGAVLAPAPAVPPAC
jgi:hypothetical protein